MRGSQVITAGDNKQLPPTSFFAASTTEGDIDGTILMMRGLTIQTPLSPS